MLWFPYGDTTMPKPTKSAPARPHLVQIDPALYREIDAFRKQSPTGIATMPSVINALLRRGYEATKTKHEAP